MCAHRFAQQLLLLPLALLLLPPPHRLLVGLRGTGAGGAGGWGGGGSSLGKACSILSSSSCSLQGRAGPTIAAGVVISPRPRPSHYSGCVIVLLKTKQCPKLGGIAGRSREEGGQRLERRSRLLSKTSHFGRRGWSVSLSRNWLQLQSGSTYLHPVLAQTICMSAASPDFHLWPELAAGKHEVGLCYLY